jgi:hypothetical protein
MSSLEEKLIRKAYGNPELRKASWSLIIRVARENGIATKEAGALGSLIGGLAKGLGKGGLALMKGVGKAVPSLGKSVSKGFSKGTKGIKNLTKLRPKLKAKPKPAKFKPSKPKPKSTRSIRKNVEKRNKAKGQEAQKGKGIVDKVKSKFKKNKKPQAEKSEGFSSKKVNKKDQSMDAVKDWDLGLDEGKAEGGGLKQKGKEFGKDLAKSYAQGVVLEKATEGLKKKLEEGQEGEGDAGEQNEGRGSEKALKQRAQQDFSRYKKKHPDTDRTVKDFYDDLVKERERKSKSRRASDEVDASELEAVIKDLDELPLPELKGLAVQLENLELEEADEEVSQNIRFLMDEIAERLELEV